MKSCTNNDVTLLFIVNDDKMIDNYLAYQAIRCSKLLNIVIFFLKRSFSKFCKFF